MNSYGREIIFVVALIFTGIAALQNGPLKTKKVNPPDIFFTPPSLITDFYQGNFGSLWTLLQEKDVALIIFYAPWDAASLQVREEIETVAKFYHNEVFFAAINCWWPEGECSKKFNPFHSYPVIMAQIHKVGAVKYEGPLISTYIISFLDSILMPLVPLHHSGELLDLLTKHEGVLVGYFKFTDGSYPKGYQQFYSTSLKALSHDPGRRVYFAVITNPKDASNFNLKSEIQLYLWNSTIVYPGEVKQKEILQWLYSKLYQVSQWISPTGAKSKTLSQSIEKQAALILFTPRNLLFDYSPYYYLQESQYVLNDFVNKNVLVEFIKNFTVGDLSRHLRMPIHKLPDCKSDGDSNICLEEVTTATFSDIVLDEKKDVVLLYYASWCGPCHSISHMFLSVADYFSNVNQIKFARISGEDNDLPWEYTVDKYPTIVFFPAKRKSESIEFPSNLMITVTNLLHFVLIHTQPRVRWNVAMQMCNRDCVAHNLIMSSKELGRLYREHRILLNNLHFVQKIVNTPKKQKKATTSDKKQPSTNYLKTVYLQDVIGHIFKKRVQIQQALQLQSILRKKRDMYLKDAKNLNPDKQRQNLNDSVKLTEKKPKHFDLRQKKDEL